MPRPVVSKLASVGPECEPKIASLERNKRDVAPRTQRDVRPDRLRILRPLKREGREIRTRTHKRATAPAAPVTGTERRQERRTGRVKRRTGRRAARRKGRAERRELRREGGEEKK